MSAIAHCAAMLPLADSRDGTVDLVLDPLRVVAFNTADGWMRDVTADIVIDLNHLELRLRELVEPTQAHDPANDGSSGTSHCEASRRWPVPWTRPRSRRRQGHHPCARAQHADQSEPGCEALLIAIAKARQVDRAIWRTTAPPASPPSSPGGKERSSGTSGCWHRSSFVSPRIVSALLDGTAPADLHPHKLASCAALLLG